MAFRSRSTSPNKLFDNKKHFDVGRMRHYLSVMNNVVINDGYGGTSVTEQLLFQTRAGRDGVSDYKKSQLVAGYSNYETAIYFIIRQREAWTLDKTMHINSGGKTYAIIDVQELDDPCTFLKILCVVST